MFFKRRRVRCRSDRERRAFVLASLAGLVAAGCSPPVAPTGTVSGLITYKDRPVTAGTVWFRNDEKGMIAAGILDSDGRYELLFGGRKNVPVGDYVVVISPPEPHMPIASEVAAGANPAGTPTPKAALEMIPPKYRSQSSGLTFEVNAGENMFDLDMRN